MYRYCNIGEAWDLRPKWREHSACDPSTKKKEREREVKGAGHSSLHLKTSRDHNYSILYVLVRVYVYVYYSTRKLRTLENSELPTVFVLCVIYGNWPRRRSFCAPCAGSATQIAPVLGVSRHDIQGGNSGAQRRQPRPASNDLERHRHALQCPAMDNLPQQSADRSQNSVCFFPWKSVERCPKAWNRDFAEFGEDCQ